jgi:hypothetical protein
VEIAYAYAYVHEAFCLLRRIDPRWLLGLERYTFHFTQKDVQLIQTCFGGLINTELSAISHEISLQLGISI